MFELFSILSGFSTIIAIAVLLFLIYKLSYIKCPVDKAAVVTGLSKRKVLVGKCGWKIPFLDSVCYVSLENIPLKINVGALAKGNINVILNGTAVVKIDNNEEAVLAASERYCNNGAKRTVEKICEVTEPIIEGALRGSSAELTPEEINESREKFEGDVKQSVVAILAPMGLRLDSYTLNDISTPDGYFKNKTEPKMAESSSLAEIAKAERQRDADIKTADAQREASRAQLKSETDIAEANRDKKVAMEQYRAEESQATVDADAAKKLKEIEKDKEIEKQNAELETFKAETIEKRLVAEIEKPAEADKKKKEIEAAAIANASLIEAEAKAKALKIAAQAEAEAIRLRGQAEADAIKAKAIAEAKGIEEKAKAFEKYNDAAKLDLLAPVIAEIGKASAESLRGIDKVTIVDCGSGDNVNGFANNTYRQIASSMDAIKDLTGVDPKAMIEKDYKKEIKLDVAGVESTKSEVVESIAETVLTEM